MSSDGAAEIEAADEPEQCLRLSGQVVHLRRAKRPRAAQPALKPQKHPSVSGSGAFVARVDAGALRAQKW